MKLMIIRHGEPDYTMDSLTEKGWKEAELLAEKISTLDVKAFYVSPLGRAKDTASLTLKKMKRTASECLWLREFEAPIREVHSGKMRIPWDQLPQDWTEVKEYYHPQLWHTTNIMKEANIKKEFEWVAVNLDTLLAEHGYQREGNLYHVMRESNEILVFFCHFGVECVMLSHLLGISPMVLWHGFCAAPSSVTTLVTEERREGIASFRLLSFGETSHLYIAGEPPSFAARFCETYGNKEERHD